MRGKAFNLQEYISFSLSSPHFPFTIIYIIRIFIQFTVCRHTVFLGENKERKAGLLFPSTTLLFSEMLIFSQFRLYCLSTFLLFNYLRMFEEVEQCYIKNSNKKSKMKNLHVGVGAHNSYC